MVGTKLKIAALALVVFIGIAVAIPTGLTSFVVSAVATIGIVVLLIRSVIL